MSFGMRRCRASRSMRTVGEGVGRGAGSCVNRALPEAATFNFQPRRTGLATCVTRFVKWSQRSGCFVGADEVFSRVLPVAPEQPQRAFERTGVACVSRCGVDRPVFVEGPALQRSVDFFVAHGILLACWVEGVLGRAC